MGVVRALKPTTESKNSGELSAGRLRCTIDHSPVVPASRAESVQEMTVVAAQHVNRCGPVDQSSAELVTRGLCKQD